MEEQRHSDLLRKSLIALIDTEGDSQSLLGQMARLIGVHLGVSACFLMTETNAHGTAEEGFWHEENRVLPLPHPLRGLGKHEARLETGQVICLADMVGDNIEGWKSIAPLQSSWAMGITFRGVRNGLAVIGLRAPRKVTGEELDQFADLRSVIGLAYATLFLRTEPFDRGRDDITHMTSTLFHEGHSQGNPLVIRLYELMRQQLEQQRQLNEMKDEIIAAISDKARNPLATMKLAINALSDTQRKLSVASRQEHWRILKNEWNTLNQLINNIVTLKQLELRELNFRPQPVNLAALIREATLPFQERWSEDKRKLLELRIENALTEERTSLETDPQHLRVILQELLSNAGNFSLAKTTVSIKVGEVDEKSIAIAVVNTGLGIAEEEKESIFEPFRRGTGITDRAIAGTGIGLALVKGLIDLLNGRIEVSSEPLPDTDAYTTIFTVILSRSVARGRESRRG